MAGSTTGVLMSPGYGKPQRRYLLHNNIRNNRSLHHQGSRVPPHLIMPRATTPKAWSITLPQATPPTGWSTTPRLPSTTPLKASEYYTTPYAAPAYYTEAPNYCNTEAPKYYTTTYAALSYYTNAPKYYSA
jgi:hypothetical protein